MQHLPFLNCLNFYFAHLGYPGSKRVSLENFIVMPEFGANDFSTRLIRGYFARMGREVHGWNRGLNIKDVQTTLEERVEDIEKRTRDAAMPIVMVG